MLTRRRIINTTAMYPKHTGWIVCAATLLCSCGTPKAKLTVAAAANLTDVFGEIGKAFKAKTGVDVIFSYGSRAEMAQHIANGAPFDVFAAADTERGAPPVSTGKPTSGRRSVIDLARPAVETPTDRASG